MPSSSSNGRAGSRNYTDGELDILLDIVEALLPTGELEWESVAAEYNKIISAKFPTMSRRMVRDCDSLRNKFKGLRNIRKPTGDPTCPPTVVRAKRIQKAIESRQGVIDFGVNHGRDTSMGDEQKMDTVPAAATDAAIDAEASELASTSTAPARDDGQDVSQATMTAGSASATAAPQARQLDHQLRLRLQPRRCPQLSAEWD